MPCLLAAALVGVTAVTGASVQSSFLGSHGSTIKQQFLQFMQEHGRTYAEGSDEFSRRFARYQEHLDAVRQQNAKPDRRWSAGVSQLADWHPDELQSLRGYRHGAKPSGGRASGGLGLVSTEVHTVDVQSLPTDVDYRHLRAMQDIQDQGSCGSCWAVASSTVLRAHTELYQEDRTFSTEQIVACTPNPKKCGGNGGCGGATAELAMDYVAKVGSATAEEMPYQRGLSGGCPAQMQAPKQSFMSLLKQAVSFPEVTLLGGGGGSSFGMMGWRRLPENKADPLMVALYENGPVVASVAASGPWNLYASGIMDECSKEAVINHAVALVGYGTDEGVTYWTIQNSWGPSWGEGGFARLPRLTNVDEEKYCGWDHSPKDGTACEGGPDKIWVCGHCGILYDNVVPKFQLSSKGLFARSGRHNLTAV